MIRFWKRAWHNPVFQLELRRVRHSRWWPGKWFFILCLLVYLLLLAGVAICAIVAVTAASAEVQLVAQSIAMVVVGVLALLVWVLSTVMPWVVPALTAAAVARERELGTLDLLRATLLPERSIVLGKLGGCLMQVWPGVFLLILLTPFQFVQLGWGIVCPGATSNLMFLVGVSEAGLAALALGVVLAVLSGALRPLASMALNATVGLFVSTFVRSSTTAITIAYGLVLSLRVFVWLATWVLNMLLSFLVIAGSADLYAAEPAGTSVWQYLMFLPGLVPLAVSALEILVAVVLVWGAVRKLAWE